MLKLFLMAGFIGGVVGPLPDLTECEAYVIDARSKMASHPELEQLKFECEYHVFRPKLTS